MMLPQTARQIARQQKWGTIEVSSDFAISQEAANVEGLKSAGKTLWWLLLIRAIFTVIFGVLILVWPKSTAATLLWVFAIFSIAGGLVDVAVGFIARSTHWGWSVFNGILGIILGVMVLRHPGAAVWVLLMFIAAWALITGFFMIFGAFSMSNQVSGGSRLWTIIAGVINVIFGILLLIDPIGTGRALWWVIGIYGIVAGVATIIAAFSARKEVEKLLAGSGSARL